MKQLYCTSAETNGHGSGVRVRAASAGIAPQQLEAAGRYAAYAWPDEEPEPGLACAAPVRLALLQTPEVGRLLCHSTRTEVGCQAFAHLLLDVPETLDAQQAIQTWGSHLWQCGENGGSTELPDALYMPVATVLGDPQLVEFLAVPRNAEMLQFLLSAVLSTPRQSRIFVAAPAEDVALCVYGITRSLPLSLLDDFTFSTYEHDPLRCPARLVGTCWNPADDRDLPAACYEPPGAAWNSYTGRHTELAAAVPFAEFAVETLALGRTTGLDEVRATWERLGLRDGALLDVVYRLARGTGTLSKEESHQVLQNPALAVWIAARPDVLLQFLEWALEDPGFATSSFSRVVAALRQKPETLARLAGTVQDYGLSALRQGNVAWAANALEGILPMVAPAQAASVWNDLLDTITDPDTLSWEMRCYLLPRLARLRPPQAGQQPEAALRRWLDVPLERLSAFLALDLPRAWQVAACLGCLRQEGAEPQALAQVLARHPALALSILQQTAADASSEAQAALFFVSILAEAPQHPWVKELVGPSGTIHRPSLLNRCLAAALQTGRVDAVSLVRAHGPTLLELIGGQHSLDRIAALLLQQPASALLADPPIGEFLAKLATAAGLSPEVRARLEGCLTVKAFLEQASVAPETLSQLAAALALHPPLVDEPTLAQLTDVVSNELAARGAEADVRTELESVLLTLGGRLAESPAALYRELLHRQLEQRHIWKQPELLHAFLAPALGAALSTELAPELDDLDAEAYALAKRLSQHNQGQLLAQMHDRSESWPKPARRQWTFLVKAVNPKQTSWGRDICAFLGGALTTAAVVLWLKFMGLL